MNATKRLSEREVNVICANASFFGTVGAIYENIAGFVSDCYDPENPLFSIDPTKVKFSKDVAIKLAKTIGPYNEEKSLSDLVDEICPPDRMIDGPNSIVAMEGFVRCRNMEAKEIESVVDAARKLCEFCHESDDCDSCRVNILRNIAEEW